MQYTISLNDLYTEYKACLLDRKKFETAILAQIRENINSLRPSGWSKEDCDDFISWFYLRVSRGIVSYQDTGASFETYISTMARLSAKEFRSRQIRCYAEESAAWAANVSGMYACENEIEYGDRKAAEQETPFKVKNPRQVLILILKCSNFITTDFLEKISPSLNIKPETLNQMIDQLREKRDYRDKAMTTLRDLASHQLYRCILYEQNLKTFMEDSIAIQRIEKKLELGRRKLKKTRRRIAQTRLDPSNSQIAEVLGVSKGTVDSVLYNLKTRWIKDHGTENDG